MLTGLGLTARELFRKAGWAMGPGSTVQEAHLLHSLADIWGAAVRLHVVNPAGAVTLQVLLAVLELSKKTLHYQQALAAAVKTTAPSARPAARQQPPPQPLRHLQQLGSRQPQAQQQLQQQQLQEPKLALQRSQQPQSAPEAGQLQPHPQQQQRQPPLLHPQQQQQRQQPLLHPQQQQLLLQHLMANSEEMPLKRPKQQQVQQQQQVELQSLARSLFHTLAGLEAAAGGSTGTATVSAGLPSEVAAHEGGGGAAEGIPGVVSAGVIADSEAPLHSGSSIESKITKVRPFARPYSLPQPTAASLQQQHPAPEHQEGQPASEPAILPAKRFKSSQSAT
jgi:hypothetical protein